MPDIEHADQDVTEVETDGQESTETQDEGEWTPPSNTATAPAACRGRLTPGRR